MKTLIPLLTLLVLVFFAPIMEAADSPPPVPEAEEPEILTRGPVNEAFAQPVALENQQGLIAPVEPPTMSGPPAAMSLCRATGTGIWTGGASCLLRCGSWDAPTCGRDSPGT